MNTIIAIVFALSATVALAEPLPVQRAQQGGSCAHTDTSPRDHSAFQVQARATPVAKPPNGTCPLGWISSGNYCLRSGANR